MPRDRQQLTPADPPPARTPETLRQVPLPLLRRLARPGNGVLSPEEQSAFDAALHEMMSRTAHRVRSQIDRSDWAAVLRDQGGRSGRRGGPQHSRAADENLRRIAERIGRQVDVAEGLAPEVDWSFAQPEELEASTPDEAAATPADDETTETVGDLEQRLSEQVELVQVMSEIAEVSRRTYALEKQRDLQSTRGLFFGFVVSVTVIVAGWAPIVAAEDWTERAWV